MTRDVSLALVQMQCSEDKQQNVCKAVERIVAAAEKGAQIICLQELFTSPYPCQEEDHRVFDWAESIPGPTTDVLGKVAAKYEVVIVASLFERRAPGLYHNTAAVLDADGSIAGIYRKMHIPDDPLYYEKFYFTPGDLGFKVIETRYAKLGVGVCWDQWFPEAARLFALGGAEILLYPTAIGWIDEEKEEFGKNQYNAWQTSMRGHAIANGLWVAAPNRVGTEGRIEFWGGSFFVAPTGEVIEQGSHSDEQTLIQTCSLDMLDLVRTHWPFLRDRRIDAYGGLLQRHLSP
ncbi:N-carbamoyl-D-amino acid hydrolase [Roseimaritima multifibrata]|uniref:N-carbamoyl-D-amino acid hydrolase n=1 Tax=Roseimaritima multifibrata TaxID=1930274 RepID=A0A517MAY4_9BACT|nr:carbon-nitrogen hydrolase [Roseimaritima multifibrata]QDS92048.1 N-carbamoyl-D-amino acid hydrolase [Roseimaritima multifibrata]